MAPYWWWPAARLRRFDLADGAELPTPALAEEYYFEDVAVAPDGRIAAIVDSEGILLLDPTTSRLLVVPQAVSSAFGDSELEADIDIDGLGNLYVLGSFNNWSLQIHARRAISATALPARATHPASLPPPATWR